MHNFLHESMHDQIIRSVDLLTVFQRELQSRRWKRADVRLPGDRFHTFAETLVLTDAFYLLADSLGPLVDDRYEAGIAGVDLSHIVRDVDISEDRHRSDVSP
jgi:hypothetical protein